MGRPAAIQRKLGRGEICYLGAVLDVRLMREIVKMLANDAGVEPAPIPVPSDVEVCRRVGPGHEVFVLINHGETLSSVRLPESMTDVLKGGDVREVAIPPKGVVVLTRPLLGIGK